MQKSYHEYIKLNKNLLIAFTAAITISAITAQLLAGQENYLNSSYTVIVDFVVFYSTFGSLFYLDNRKKYLSESGVGNKRLKKDLIKIISSLGIGEIIYTSVRWFLQYYFLTIQYEPYLASTVAHLTSTAVYLICVNLSVKFTRLYKDDT